MVFGDFNIWPVKSVETVIFVILSNANEIHFSGSRKYKKFLKISIFDQWYQLKPVSSETISNVNEIRNCNSAFNSEQDYVYNYSKRFCVFGQ